MTRKTGTKWGTNKCGRCGQSHYGYSGKLDKNNVEYVVCENTHKRMNVSGIGKEGNSDFFKTSWITEDGYRLVLLNPNYICQIYEEK